MFSLPATSVAGQGVSQSRLSSLLNKLEAHAPILLGALIVLWIGVIFAASAYKYETFGQGYDQVDFEQAIWNTTQGRVMEDSRFDFTDSIFGMDWMPMLLFFVPVYALIPSAHALFFLQIAASALGAVPVYWLARDRLGSKLVGLCFGAVYLLYPTLLHTALNPFQVRLFALTLLLFGFYHFERSNWKLFAACALLAMLARTDVALVVAMFGVYGLLTRRRWPYVVAPLALGFGYFALSTFVIVPSFLHPAAFSAAGDGSMQCWPCGSNPILAYYGHLGRSGPEIIGYILAHPIEVAQLMFTGPKLWYILSLLVPLAFLPLLAPRPLVLGLPILALNLLSLRAAQFDYAHHYSLLLIPGLLASAIYGADALQRMWAKRAKRHGKEGISLAPVQLGAMALVVWTLAMQVPYKNPAVSAFLYPEPPARVAAAHDLIGMVPREAKVAVSSKLAPHLLPRRYIYNFPPAAYSPYNFGPRRSERYSELDYILVDPEASALKEEENKIEGKSGLEWLAQLPEWERVAEREGLLLFRRR
ncbi:MAG TPA: DUF2079 domain-containing protein [Chloroflexia bacterium]